jgi:hypothetical protein
MPRRQFIACVATVLLMSLGRSVNAASSTNTVTIGGAEIVVQFRRPGEIHLPKATVMQWVRRAAEAVSLYYGQFPIHKAIIRVQPVQGDEIGFATADFAHGSSVIEIPVGVDISERDLKNDWTLTHEMVHLAFPLMDDTHRWVAEGMATYIEPIARMRVGATSPAQLWGEFAKNFSLGLPKKGDRGLNHTHTRDRTYEGGALFCLQADLAIRRQTGNKKGLEDALRAILRSGANISSDVEPLDAFKIGDHAVGGNVLENMYHAMKDKPVAANLPRIWKDLGVRLQGDEAIFDNSAPLAATRLAINGSSRN